ncbi:MAG: hypothetical protein KME55_36890 [Nostoc indistinguendum CM1-VF10]|nr:hypothetical protein [Nostoc indistinguendum CM1-VF10]
MSRATDCLSPIQILLHRRVSCGRFHRLIPILQNEATDVNQESLAASKFLNCELRTRMLYKQLDICC